MFAISVACLSGLFAILFLIYCFREFRREAGRRLSAKYGRRNAVARLVSGLAGRGWRGSRMYEQGARNQTRGKTHTKVLVVALGVVLPTMAASQASSPNAGQASAPPVAPLSAPAMVGPLSLGPPRQIVAGPFGKLDVNGTVSGFGLGQSQSSASDETVRGDISNAQLFLQKPDGMFQFYLQAGAYNIPALGAPMTSTERTVSDFFGPLPVAYLKFARGQSFSILAGKLPTLIGAEDTFSFENGNIERGLLWNQENAVNRGVQVNAGRGRMSASLSWNDGFYSNRYNWLTGALTEALNGTNSIEFTGGGNLGHTGYSDAATPMYPNNGSIYDLMYSHTARRWMMEPYLQYTRVPGNAGVPAADAASTVGGALLGSYSLTSRLSLTGRVEYIAATGGAHAANLLFGPGSDGWSLTLTPTYQHKSFFARSELSLTGAEHFTEGDGFAAMGNRSLQVRGMVEAGFLF